MTVVSCLLVLYFFLYFSYVVYLITALHRKKNQLHVPYSSLPFVSVLIAARNEAANILGCLQSIESLDYPIDKLEILIGNDDSEDQTRTIVERFIAGKP